MDVTKIQTIKNRLLAEPEPYASAREIEPEWLPDVPFIDAPVPAAVLIALVRRPDGPTVIYTERSSSLRKHSGQVAFPGGRVDQSDVSVAHAALREAQEEVKLNPEDAEVIGYLPPMFTGTNFLITPVVAVVDPSGPFVPNPDEVDEVFEVPLSLIANPESYGRYSIEMRGETRWTWQIDYEGHVIWGITANLTYQFREMALDGVAA